MSTRRGIGIPDLLPQTSGPALQVPDGIVEQLGVLTILDHRSTTSADFFLHEGTLQSAADALDMDTANWPIRIPGLTQGLPFRLAIARSQAAAGAEEPVPLLWTLDIEVWNVEVLIPGVHAARPAGGTGVTPLTLQATGTTDATKRVFLVGSGVVRVSGGGPGGTIVQIVDAPDPLDPAAPTGAVIRLTARPSSFLFGQSKFGMTLDQFVLDLSKTFTPPEIAARGHDETWEGVAFRETTFYFPPDTPLVHSLSVSARDVILGDPGGLQGELRVEFGQDFNDVYNTRIAVKRQGAGGAVADVPETTPLPRGTGLQFAVAAGPNGVAQRVRAEFAVGADQFVPGHTDLAVVGVWWKLPDGSEGTSSVTPWFDAPTTAAMHYRLRAGDPSTAPNAATPASAVPLDQTELGEVTVAFPRDAASPSGAAPLLDTTIGGTLYSNIIHLRGPRTRLQGIVLSVRGGGQASWQLGAGSAPQSARDVASFTLPLLPDGTTTLDLTAQDSNGTRRVRVEATRQGPLAIGHQSSAASGSAAVVTVVGSGDASPISVAETFLAAPFHLRGDHNGAPNAATFSGTQITVPQGADAEVEVPVPVDQGAPNPPPVIPPNITSSTVQVLYEWDQASPVRVVYPYAGPDTADAPAHDPDARPMAQALDQRIQPDGGDPAAQIRSWLAALGAPNGRKYFVVGRTDDLKQGGTLPDNDTYNDALANARAAAAADALVAAGAAAGDISQRNEHSSFSSAPPGSPPARITAPGRLALPAARVATGPGGAPVWNTLWNADGVGGAAHFAARNDSRRSPYRCAEIYAVDTGSPAPPPPVLPAQGGVPTRMLVPGPDGTPDPGVHSTTTAPPPTDYRVRLRVKWDSPTVVSLGDAIPTETEALVAWKKAQVELPPTASGTGPAIPPPTGPDFWEVLLQWAYDARTGETSATGALSLPDGTLTWQNNVLAGALGFGPAFTALLNPSDTIRDPLGQFASAAALLAVGAAIGELINSSGPESTVDIDKFAISYKWNGAAHAGATVDYTITLRVNVSISGAGSLTGRLKLSYKGVGIRFDGAPGGGLAGVALTYDDLSVQVVDPGTWSLGGPLGDLIRIAASRMGNGSQWMEFDLAFALDLGVVTLEGATIRLGISPFLIELRGLTASIDVPGAVKGRGSLTVGDGGAFRALLALEVIPAKLSAYGSLAVDHDFVAVEVGIQLPVGIPLGGTGFGIFGFMGRFVANGTRNLEGLTNPDPVQKQLDWYVRSPSQKYSRRSGQFAFGVGAVVGTLPDSAFTFNAEGSLTIGFPDVSVIFGIDAHLLQQRKSQATESGTANTAGLRILGMVLIDESSIMVAVRASYMIPKVLRLEIPVSAFFPLAGTDAWFIRIGSDNEPAVAGDHPARPGNPVTVTLFPGLLDIRAWAFVMIEERQLHHLGGTLVPLDLAQPLDFDGFSIGVGAGFDLKWSAGPFKLEISAFLLVGVGTKPLLFAGAAGIRGELDLVVISVGVDGLVHFHISPGFSFVEGHFCGHVDLFFFTVSGCVDIRIGDDPPNTIPAPESPFAGLDLCDHLAAVKGRAARTDADPVPTVWPDTIGVLRCNHYIEDGLGTGDFNRRLPSPAPLSPWSGASELKYAFRLKTLELWKLTGPDPGNPASWTKMAGPFDSAWWMPSFRAAVIEGGGAPGPGTEEGRELGLFSWDPRAWSRWLGDGSQDLPGDPANTAGQVCDPAHPAAPSCAHGKDRTFAPGRLGAFKAQPAPGSAIPSRFTVFAGLPTGIDAGTLATLGAEAGWIWSPGAVLPLHGPVALHGETLNAGWHFPEWRTAGSFVASAPMVLELSRPLLEGELVLEICSERALKPPPISLCDAMPNNNSTFEAFTGTVSSSKYGGLLQGIAVGAERAVRLLRPLSGTFPSTTDSVAVDLQCSDGTATLTAFGAPGAALGTATSTGTGRQWLRISAKGITRITVAGPSSAVSVLEVCWGGNPGLAILSLIDFEPGATPEVIAFDDTGKAVSLQGTPGAIPPPPPQTAVVQRCPKLIYTLPKGRNWTRITIAPWLRGGISLVALCGVTAEAAAAQQADQGYRDAFKTLLLGLVQAAIADQPTHNVYLDQIATYEIRAAWQWQGFRPANPGNEPPATSSGTWTDAAAAERFRFTTAAFGLASPPASAQTTSLDVDPAQGGPGYDERSFDPRGIARYLTNATPTHEDPPQFLDDPVGFWFMVDHLEKLVEKYDRILQVKVLHTTPPPGSLHAALPHVPGDVHILDVTVSANWTVDTLAWFQADLRLIQAAQAAPCIGGAPSLGSASVTVSANLEPRQEYDLLLNTAPKVVGAFPEVPVARSHFRTSRYRNPTGLLRALGFFDPLGVVTPTDAIAAAALPPAALAIGDAALDAALTTLGLDPWPLPAGPRTTVIWLAPAGAGQPWRIAAALIEADEPVWRAGFRTGAVGEPDPPPRLEIQRLEVFRTFEQIGVVLLPLPHSITTTLRTSLGSFTEQVRNAAGTRSIFVPTAPIAMTGGRLYELAIHLLERGLPGAHGVAAIVDRPLMLAEEGE